MMKNRILILGGNGLLGSMCRSYLSKTMQTHALVRQSYQHSDQNIYELDIRSSSDFASITNLISKINPDYIVNCLGVINSLQSKISDYEYHSYLINTSLPIYLSKYHKHTKIIHVTTDCIYDGQAGNYYQGDSTYPQSIYGQSKYLGETCAKNILNIRLSLIGPELYTNRGLFDYIVTNKNTEISGYTNHIWNGVTSLQFSQYCEQIILYQKFNALVSLDTPYMHLVMHRPISKFDLLCKINMEFQLNKLIMPTKTQIPINRALCTIYKSQQKSIQYSQSLSQLKTYILNNNFRGKYEQYIHG